MKVYVASVVVAVIIAGGAMYGLDRAWQLPADQAFNSPTSVRIPDHGTTHNLVGKDWYSASEH
jgi:hypothetical protein